MWKPVLLLLAMACGGGAEDDTSGTDALVPTGDTAPAALSHADDVQSIWKKRCSPCHLEGRTDGSIGLDDGYQMVGQASSDVPTMDLVSPGSLEDSYLWHKLSDTQSEVGGSGGIMPKNDTLTKRQMDTVQLWIEQGALP
jgi:hypothetical protein